MSNQNASSKWTGLMNSPLVAVPVIALILIIIGLWQGWSSTSPANTSPTAGQESTSWLPSSTQSNAESIVWIVLAIAALVIAIMFLVGAYKSIKSNKGTWTSLVFKLGLFVLIGFSLLSVIFTPAWVGEQIMYAVTYLNEGEPAWNNPSLNWDIGMYALAAGVSLGVILILIGAVKGNGFTLIAGLAIIGFSGLFYYHYQDEGFQLTDTRGAYTAPSNVRDERFDDLPLLGAESFLEPHEGRLPTLRLSNTRWSTEVANYSGTCIDWDDFAPIMIQSRTVDGLWTDGAVAGSAYLRFRSSGPNYSLELLRIPASLC